MKARNLVIGTLMGAVALGGFAAPAFATSNIPGGDGANTQPPSCETEEVNGIIRCKDNPETDKGWEKACEDPWMKANHPLCGAKKKEEKNNNNGNNNGNRNGNNNGNGNGGIHGNGNKYQNINGNDNKLYMDSFNSSHYHNHNSQYCVSGDCKGVKSGKGQAKADPSNNGKGNGDAKATASQVSFKPQGGAATGGGFTATR